MKFLKLILVTIFFIFVSSSVFAQTPKFKFGKLNKGEAEMSSYSKDTSATAVILFDKGFSYFGYDNNKKGWKIIFQRSLRIKIFKKDASSYADFEIPLYIGDHGSKEDITSLRGKTFNVENGKLVVTKVKKSNIFYDNKSENRKIAKVSFPDVREGSVIDFEYTIDSDFIYNLRGWQFQYEIPVIYSEYSTLIPEYFIYHRNQKGYDDVYVTEKNENRNESFRIEYKTLPQSGGVVEKGAYEINSNSALTTWTALTIPAFVREPNMTTAKNFMTAIEFELKSYTQKGRPAEYFTTSWNDVNKKLSNNKYFGKQLVPTKKIKLQAEEICRDAKNKEEEVQAIYKWITENIKWNEYNSLFIDDKLNSVLVKKTGNASDINMLLINLLKSKQINAGPIILSTRAHGMVFPTHPSISVFNYVIAEVKIDDKTYYLDATDDNLPFGMLPYRCLNGIGRKYGTPNFDEIQIIPSKKHEVTDFCSIEIIPGEEIKGKVAKVYKGYAAYEMRDDITEAGGEEEYIKSMTDNTESAELSDVVFSDLEEINKPLKESFIFSSSENVTFAGNMIYLTPLLNERTKNNPFKLEERKYPVDYAYPYTEKLIFQFKIPEGYEIAEKPEKAVFALPGRSAQFKFQTSVAGNIVQVISIFKINKPVFQSDSYKGLKNFYDLVIKKQNEKIVLKKI